MHELEMDRNFVRPGRSSDLGRDVCGQQGDPGGDSAVLIGQHAVNLGDHGVVGDRKPERGDWILTGSKNWLRWVLDLSVMGFHWDSNL